MLESSPWTPRRGYKPINRDSEVLTGMEGTMWIDQTAPAASRSQVFDMAQHIVRDQRKLELLRNYYSCFPRVVGMASG